MYVLVSVLSLGVGIIAYQICLWRKFNRLWYQNYLNICALKKQAKEAGHLEFEAECDRYLRAYYEERNMFL